MPGKIILLLSSMLLLICQYLSAQEKIYFDDDWNETDEINAAFYRIIKAENGLYEISDHYISGALQFEGRASNTTDPLQLEGKSIWYYEDGVMSQEAFFVENIPDGKYIEYYSNGVQKSERTYSMGVLNGVYREFFPSGEVQLSAGFLNDQLHGKYTKYSSEEVPEEEMSFKDGEVDGPYAFYLGNGNLLARGNAVEGFQDGYCEEFTYNGDLRRSYTVKNAFLDGELLEFNSSGDTLTIGIFRMGEAISYSSSAARNINGSEFSAEMERNGEVEEWKIYRDGRLVLESFYREGKFHVKWKVYSFDGASLFEERDFSDSDCDDGYLQKASAEFRPFFETSSRFSDYTEMLKEQDCSTMISVVYYGDGEIEAQQDHPLYHTSWSDVADEVDQNQDNLVVKDKDPKAEKSKADDEIDYKDPANKEAFKVKNNCSELQDGPNITVCRRVFGKLNYTVCLSEDAQSLDSLRSIIPISDDELIFFYQKFEDRIYSKEERPAKRYMSFKLPAPIRDALREGIMDDIGIIRNLEHEIFDEGSFSGMAAYGALEEELER